MFSWGWRGIPSHDPQTNVFSEVRKIDQAVMHRSALSQTSAMREEHCRVLPLRLTTLPLAWMSSIFARLGLTFSILGNYEVAEGRFRFDRCEETL